MEIGLGAMQMRPDDFWGQSLPEWLTRIAGFIELHGGGGSSDEFTSADLAELEATIAAEEAAKSAPSPAPPRL